MRTEFEDGVSVENGYVLVPDMHPRWPGLRGNQAFAPVFGEGMILAIDDLSLDQMTALFPPEWSKAEIVAIKSRGPQPVLKINRIG